MTFTGVPKIDPHDPTHLVAGGKQLFLAGYYPGLQALTSGPHHAGKWYRPLIDQMAGNGLNLLRTVSTFGMALRDNQWFHPWVNPVDGTEKDEPLADLSNVTAPTASHPDGNNDWGLLLVEN